MCNDFSCLITDDCQVFWKRGVSSHDHLETMFDVAKNHRFIKAEITPDAGYLYPEKSWTFQIDESETPDWFTDAHKLAAMRELRKWKKEVYALINLEEARNPINPLTGKKKKTTKTDIENLKIWASVGDSVWASVGDSVAASVGDSVWDSVAASVGDSVGAYTGGLFNIWNGDYKFQPAIDLWKRGFVASFDGKTWRLLSGAKADIVFTYER
jgi:hypothetical protein